MKALEYAKIDTSVVAVQLLPPSVREMAVSSSGLLSEELNVQEAAQLIRNSSVGMIGIWPMGYRWSGKDSSSEEDQQFLCRRPFL